jgi:hypothetical protein
LENQLVIISALEFGFEGRHTSTVSHMSQRGARLAGLILAIALGYFLFLRVRSAWANYWLLTDARQGTAIVTYELWSGHNVVAYKYIVGQNEYTGHSGRNSSDEKYSHVQPGEKSIVYFSASHPWLSSLSMPEYVAQGWPVILVVVAFEMFALITIIKPSSGWAFSFIEKEPKGDTDRSRR